MQRAPRASLTVRTGRPGQHWSGRVQDAATGDEVVVTRCRWAISFVTMATRCDQPAGHAGAHEGPGLFEFQRIEWLPNDRRQHESDRDDALAWEIE